MAAKQQSGKKALKWKRVLKSKQQLTVEQRKLRSQKKKAQGRVKSPAKKASANKAGISGEPRISSPWLLASKMLQQMPKVHREAKAWGLVKILLTGLNNHVETHVETLSQKIEVSTINYTDVQMALKEAMEKKLTKHTVEPLSNECA